MYDVGFRRLADQSIARPSPLRFMAVTLKPGEITELPEYELGPSNVKRVTVSFSVEQSYAEEQSWWHGSLIAENERPEETPNQALVPTTTAVTPAANAPVAPAAAAAHL
jgi:hypothetical protein